MNQREAKRRINREAAICLLEMAAEGRAFDLEAEVSAEDHDRLLTALRDLAGELARRGGMPTTNGEVPQVEGQLDLFEVMVFGSERPIKTIRTEYV
jgi:hypothetical protein